MVAHSHGGTSTLADAHPSRSMDWRELGLERLGHLSRIVELSTAYNTAPRQPFPSRADEACSILSGLIGDLVENAQKESEHLLLQYGSLPEIYQHCVDHDAPINGVSASVSARLRNVARLVDSVLHQEIKMAPLVSNFKLLAKRLSVDMAHLPRETFRVLFLNAENRLVGDKVLWEGSVRTVQVHPREVVRHAIETEATAVIFAHNHPSGDPTPSRSDIEITQKLIHACASIDVVVHDHIVLASRGYVSLRASGIFPNQWSPGGNHTLNERLG